MIAWPFLNDSGLYAQLGRTVASGGVLYRDFYETKLPGAALLASVFWRSFGPHWAGYVLCQLTLALLAAAALARAAHRHIASTSALPVFLFATVFLNLAQAVYTGFQLETLQAFFEALAAMAAIESLCNDDVLATFAAGLAAGTAAMAKPGGLGVAAAFLVMLVLFGRRRVVHILFLSIGIAIPTAITSFYTWKTGAWEYAPGVLRDIAHYASGTPVDAAALLKLVVVLSIFVFPFAMRCFKTERAMGGTPMILFFASLWFVIDLLAVLLQRRLYPYHFLPLACPAAILYGMLPRRATPISVALGVLPVALLSLTWEGSDITQLSRGFVHMPVSNYIATHTTVGDTVFADQIGRLLIETERQPGTRLGTFFYMVNDDDAPARYARILLDDFESRKPKYLVLAHDRDLKIPGLANCDILQHAPARRENFIAAWATLRDYVAARYHPETSIDGWIVYRRNR